MPAIRLLAACGAALAAAAAVAPAAAADCPDASSQPDHLSMSDYEAAVICLVNEARAEQGVAELSPQRNLDRAAGWHSADMVENQYFSHTEPDGTTFADRLDAVHFAIPSGRWGAGENLGGGEGAAGTPAALVQGWLDSPRHRQNMLDPGFTLVGVGAARGWPGQGYHAGPSVTVTMDLGWRGQSRHR